jgi:hypothetical protein
MIICKKGIKEEENAMEMETKTGRPASHTRDRACSWCRTKLLLLLFFFFFFFFFDPNMGFGLRAAAAHYQ